MDLIKVLYTMGALSVREMKDLRTLHRDNEKISKRAASVVITMNYATFGGGSWHRFFIQLDSWKNNVWREFLLNGILYSRYGWAVLALIYVIAHQWAVPTWRKKNCPLIPLLRCIIIFRMWCQGGRKRRVCSGLATRGSCWRSVTMARNNARTIVGHVILLTKMNKREFWFESRLWC